MRSRFKRLWRLVRWLIKTPWPLFALDLLRSNLIGALFVFGFLRFAVLPGNSAAVDQLGQRNQILFVAYLAAATIVGGIVSLWLVYPVLVWHRRRNPEDAAARTRTLRLPLYTTVLTSVLWIIGGIIFVVSNARSSNYSQAIIIAITTFLGAVTTCALSYMQVEKVLRPITVAALAGSPPSERGLSVSWRIILWWIPGTLVPVAGIVVLLAARRYGVLEQGAEQMFVPITVLSIAAIAVSLMGNIRVASAIGDPVRELRLAQSKVSSGNMRTRVRVYDGTELGLLQDGFNQMVSQLAERQRLRDMFGRYVGEDVARRAIERSPELGGSEREVAVLFVDIVGSTQLALNSSPKETVSLLNDFFTTIVAVVSDYNGLVNKFMGDAALVIFNAPIMSPDPAGAALAAAREMRARLAYELSETEIGIGVSFGRAVAGHIGAKARFEYTVIGDPVNEASRITELAKLDSGHVLASSAAIAAASEQEARHWQTGETVVLRGRGGIPTELFYPLISDGPTTVHPQNTGAKPVG